MKFLLLCRKQHGSAKNEVVQTFTNESKTKDTLIEEYLNEYITSDKVLAGDYKCLGEGSKHIPLINQSAKTVDQILLADDLPFDRHYIRFDNGVWHLYEKYKEDTEVKSGWIFESTSIISNNKIREIATFEMIKHNLEVYDYIQRCSCNEKPATTKQSMSTQAKLEFVDQLKSIFAERDGQGVNVVSVRHLLRLSEKAGYKKRGITVPTLEASVSPIIDATN
jgi:hypothetical protein